MFSSIVRGACAVALFAVASAPARAADVPQPTPSTSAAAVPDGALPQIGRVVTSDRRDEPVAQSSRPTFVVDRARIEAYGARTVADALQDVPGVDLASYGAFGAQVNYGIRGALSAQTLVLVDGLPVADPTTGAVQLGQLSTVGVERIEVVESGSSTLYGTNASGGVINVITRVPRGAYLEASSGSFADRDARASIGNGVVGATYERHVATNDYPYPGFTYSGTSSCGFGAFKPCAFAGGTRNFAYGDQSAGRISLDAPLGRGFRVRGRADATDTQIGAPGGFTFASSTASQLTTANSTYLELERASRTSTFTVDLSGSQTRLAFVDPVNAGGESDTYTGRSQLSLRDAISGPHVDLVAGIDAARESGVFSFPSMPNFATPGAAPLPPSAVGAAQAQSAAYVQAGVSPLSGTRFTAGLRGENDSPHGSVLAPSFGGTIRSGRVRFAGNVGESFRVPTLEDLYYPGASNPNLQPEKAQTADVTVAYDSPAATLSAGWFDRNGSNFIVFDLAKFVPVNAQRAATAGLALTATSKPFAGLVASASLTNLYRSLDLTTGARLPFSPVTQTTLELTHPFARGNVAYGLRYGIVGSDGSDRGNVAPPLSGSYDAYATLDAFVRYRLAPDAIVTVRGFNLGDERYAPIFGYPAPGRRAYVEVSTR